MWNRTKSTSKAGFDKLWQWSDKLGAPVNKLSNKLGSEAFWPTTLDKESDKAARILRSFCKDGFYEEVLAASADGPKQKQKVLKKIPAEVIRNAKGLAVFTTMRTGLWVSGAGGSGILVGRTEDGSWSPPSGIMLHTAGLGFLIGVDIYDCVIVINTQEALDAFSKVRCTVGGEVSAVAGPVGVGGLLETELHKRQAPIFTYLKSRGFYAGVQIDGTIVIERTDENERFYNERIGVHDILAGKVRHPPYEVRTLMETIKAAEGDTNVDEALLTTEPPPGDYEVEEDGHTFGVPDREDPDPYGVLALEKQGLQIVEAGSKIRPPSEQFEFHPNPASPIYSTFSNRRSVDSKSIRDSQSLSRRSSRRTSTLSMANTIKTDRSVQTVDMCTQTDFDSPVVNSPRLSMSNGNASPQMAEIPEDEVLPTTQQQAQQTKTNLDAAAKSMEKAEEDAKSGKSPQVTSPTEEDDDDIVEVEEPVVHQLQQAAAPQVIQRARLVTVSKPSPPKLPPRNPIRNRKGPVVINADPLTAEEAAREHGSSSPRGSIKTGDGSSVRSHRSQESASSAEQIDGVNGHVAKIKLHDEQGVEQNVADEAMLSKQDSDDSDFHSIPATPNERPRSPIELKDKEEDFS